MSQTRLHYTSTNGGQGRTRAGVRSGAVLSGRKYVNSVSRSLCASNNSATCTTVGDTY